MRSLSRLFHPHDRPDLNKIHLSRSNHIFRKEGTCAMEALAYYAGERHSDHPKTASVLLTYIVQKFNDSWSDQNRQRLVELVPILLDTRANRAVETQRAYRILDTVIRQWPLQLLGEPEQIEQPPLRWFQFQARKQLHQQQQQQAMLLQYRQQLDHPVVCSATARQQLKHLQHVAAQTQNHSLKILAAFAQPMVIHCRKALPLDRKAKKLGQELGSYLCYYGILPSNVRVQWMIDMLIDVCAVGKVTEQEVTQQEQAQAQVQLVAVTKASDEAQARVALVTEQLQVRDEAPDNNVVDLQLQLQLAQAHAAEAEQALVAEQQARQAEVDRASAEMERLTERLAERAYLDDDETDAAERALTHV